MVNTLDKIRFVPADSGTALSGEDLVQIARLVYETDPYIYPALFCCPADADRIIPALIEDNDAMFCRKNLFLAVSDNGIAGIILWNRGPLVWEPDGFINASEQYGIPLSPALDLVRTGYFDGYREIPADTISLINVCVRSDLHGQGIGKKLLKAFLDRHPECDSFELYVLADNSAAVKLYESEGFCITETLQGFAVEQQDLPCFKMIRMR